MIHYFDGGRVVCGSRNVRAWSRLRRAVDCPACLACLALERAQQAVREAARDGAGVEALGQRPQEATRDFELALQANLVVGRA